MKACIFIDHTRRDMGKLCPQKLLVSFSTLLLLALNPEPTSAHTQLPSLYQDDVNTINIIARSLKLNWETDESDFSSKRCNSSTLMQCDCSYENHTLCRVTDINFSDKHLKGEISPVIGNLTFLKSLDLHSNKIHGRIPDTLRKLSQLSYIDLSQNNLQGEIPNFFDEMSSLNVLVLAQNWLSGPIPATLGRLTSLYILDMQENLLSGQIPDELGNISSLVSIKISDNNISGELPQSLGNLKNLGLVSLANNNFRGTLPQSFGNLMSLTYFNVRGNEIVGRIPSFIGNWTKIQTLILTGNNFEGPIPDTISSLTSLAELRIADLRGSNRGEDFSFPDLSRMTSLSILILRNCSFTGPIPSHIGQLPNLSYLDLSFNNFTGAIPFFLHYKSLTNLYLKGNKLTGSLPPWFTDLTETNVDFSENNFTDVPLLLNNTSKHMNSFACCSPTSKFTFAWQRKDFLCDNGGLKNRLFINCGGERIDIQGDTYEPDMQGEGTSTFYLNDDRNWAYSSMGVYYSMQKFMKMNYTVDTPCGVPMIEAPLYRTARVAPVSLKYYGFCLENDKYKVTLHFAEIAIKEEVDHKSRGKRIFDVIIQGKKFLTNFNIKEAAGGSNRNVTKTFDVDVKDNQLEIHLYWSSKGSNNHEIYGPLISAISVHPVPKPRKALEKLSALSIAAIAGSVILIPVLVLLILWKMGYLGRKEPQCEERKDLESLPGGFFSFRQIKTATQNFNSGNKIGEGGFGCVYKGMLPNGTAIAVKQLSAKSKQGSREFVNEVGVISALQHPNLVRLLGCCIEENQLILVYGYMENNSLAHALFGSEGLRSQLNWATRVKICHGIAKGLAFLHEESTLKIVHRDIKTTNILLDKDFNAKISDFGFAKLYETEKTHVITKIAGTTGYMAPEYAMRGHLTSKADVYSFGVVMLEIVSGQNSASYRPNDESVYLLDLAYVLQEKGDLVALVDPFLGSDYSLKEAKMILDLAMICTNPSPTLRPTMSEVVRILQGKSRLKSAPIHAPYSADGFAMAKAIASRSFSIHSAGSFSREETSNPAVSHEISKEEEVHNISDDYSLEITDKTEGSLV